METIKNEVTYYKKINSITVDIGDNSTLTFNIWSELDIFGDDGGFDFDDKSLKLFNSFNEKKQNEIMDYIHDIDLGELIK